MLFRSIYICIPKTSLNFARKEEKVLDPHGNTLTKGTIGSVSYNDYDLLETTNLTTALEYIKNNLKNDLELFRNGNLNLKHKSSETKWLDSDQLRKFDKSQLAAILNMRTYETQEQENAADFIDNIKDEVLDNSANIDNTELPL